MDAADADGASRWAHAGWLVATVLMGTSLISTIRGRRSSGARLSDAELRKLLSSRLDGPHGAGGAQSPLVNRRPPAEPGLPRLREAGVDLRRGRIGSAARELPGCHADGPGRTVYGSASGDRSLLCLDVCGMRPAYGIVCRFGRYAADDLRGTEVPGC